MKSILLATASILAFAGAAAADVTFGGSATLGFNEDNGDEPRDTDTVGGVDVVDDGFFWEADLGVTLTQELNSGVTAAASFGLNVVDDDGGDNESISVDNNFLLSLTTENGGLFFGETEYAAFSKWDAAGDMSADDFSEQDNETVLKGETIFSGVEVAISYNVTDEQDVTPQDDLDQLSLGAKGAFGRFTFSAAYQEESEIVDNPTGAYAAYDDFSVDEVFGLSAGTTFGGADVQVAYAQNNTDEDTSLGLEVAYPIGPVTLGAYYVLEEDDAGAFDLGNDDVENSFGVSADYASGPLAVSAFYELSDAVTDAEGGTVEDNDNDDDEDNNYGIEIGYDSGAGIEVYAGYIDEDGGYVGIEYDLGNGAELIASYADEDEEGAREYEGGTTVQVSLEF